MSYVKMVTIICDFCGTSADASGWTVAEARKIARQLGWSYGPHSDKLNNLDLCPSCTEKDNRRAAQEVTAQLSAYYIESDGAVQ